ncbi:MAG TPA: hypothetical protein VF912_17370 [Anaeromyxobacter sp.]
MIRAIEACYSGAEEDASWLREILDALAPLDQGIGMFLGLHASAIATHLASARRKLGLASRTELVRELASLVRSGEDRAPHAPHPGA